MPLPMQFQIWCHCISMVSSTSWQSARGIVRADHQAAYQEVNYALNSTNYEGSDHQINEISPCSFSLPPFQQKRNLFIYLFIKVNNIKINWIFGEKSCDPFQQECTFFQGTAVVWIRVDFLHGDKLFYHCMFQDSQVHQSYQQNPP